MNLREQLIAQGVIRPAKEAEQIPAKAKASPMPRVTIKKQPKPKPKKFHNLPLAEKVAIRQANRTEAPLRCPLCGQQVEAGGMLKHKAAQHNEQEVTPSPPRLATEPPTARFLPGGSPGLKRK